MLVHVKILVVIVVVQAVHEHAGLSVGELGVFGMLPRLRFLGKDALVSVILALLNVVQSLFLLIH